MEHTTVIGTMANEDRVVAGLWKGCDSELFRVVCALVTERGLLLETRSRFTGGERLVERPFIWSHQIAQNYARDVTMWTPQRAKHRSDSKS